MFHISYVHVRNWNQTSDVHLSSHFSYPKSILNVKFTWNCERSFALQDPWVAPRSRIFASRKSLETDIGKFIPITYVNIGDAEHHFFAGCAKGRDQTWSQTKPWSILERRACHYKSWCELTRARDLSSFCMLRSKKSKPEFSSYGGDIFKRVWL